MTAAESPERTAALAAANGRRYERQEEAEARCVRAVDKGMPKIVHFQDAVVGLAREGISAEELAGIYQRQACDSSFYAGGFTALTQLRRELAARVVAMVTGSGAQRRSPTIPPTPDVGVASPAVAPRRHRRAVLPHHHRPPPAGLATAVRAAPHEGGSTVMTVTLRAPAPGPAAAPGLYKIRDVMQLLQMSRSVIYEQIRAGRLRTVKQGRSTFITAAAITDYIELLEREASATGYGKAAEFQARAAVHFHAVLRLDGVHPDDLDAVIPPPTGITVADLDDAIRQAATTIAFTTASHPDRPGGWLIPWGDQVDVRVITMRGENTVTDAMVAAYLAKYSTKGTEATGHASARITDNTIDLYSSSGGSHVERLIHSCWMLGKADSLMFGKTHGWDSLRRWAHMLGFGGHFLTKGRRYSVTFGALRSVRAVYRRNETTGPEHDPIRTADHVGEETTLIIWNLWYAGTGWKTTGDALLANTAADQARRRREAGREDLAEEYGSLPDDRQAA